MLAGAGSCNYHRPLIQRRLEALARFYPGITKPFQVNILMGFQHNVYEPKVPERSHCEYLLFNSIKPSLCVRSLGILHNFVTTFCERNLSPREKHLNLANEQPNIPSADQSEDRDDAPCVGDVMIFDTETRRR